MAFLILASVVNMYAQLPDTGIQSEPVNASGKNAKFYAGYNHQHQRFFEKAFSYQGIETGFIIDDKFLLGAYGSAFVSNLAVETDDQITNYLFSQAGMLIGFVHQKPKLIHPGILLTIGYVSINGDDSKMPIFNAPNQDIQTEGLAISPQLFAEIIALKWLKIRTGLGYNFYRINDQSDIKNSEIQDVAFTFGVFFGSFK